MNSQARLGAFVLLALILLAFATGRIADYNWSNQKPHIVEAEFNDLMGLDVQSPVRMAGVKVGSVHEILLRENRAVVRIALNSDIRLPASTRAAIISRGLVGEKNLALTAIPGDKKLLPEGSLIPTDETGDINSLITKATAITDDISTLTASLSGTDRRQSRESFQQLLGNINTAAEELSMMVRENRTAIREITSSLQAITSRLEKELPATVREGQNFFREGKQAASNINSAFLDNQENLYRSIYELRMAAENFAAFSDDIRRNPWKVMIERPEVAADKRAQQQHMEEMLMNTGSMGLTPARQ